MHDETKRQLIESGTKAAGTLLNELLVHRNQIEVLEAEKEKELELAKTRAQHTGGHEADSAHADQQATRVPASNGVGQPADPVEATPAEIEQALDELIEEEMCSVCRELLIALKDRPTRDQVRGIMEYGTFKHNLDDGAGVDQLKELIRETDVLHEIFQEKYNPGGM